MPKRVAVGPRYYFSVWRCLNLEVKRGGEVVVVIMFVDEGRTGFLPGGATRAAGLTGTPGVWEILQAPTDRPMNEAEAREFLRRQVAEGATWLMLEPEFNPDRDMLRLSTLLDRGESLTAFHALVERWRREDEANGHPCLHSPPCHS
jgi:hypothetical protein